MITCSHRLFKYLYSKYIRMFGTFFSGTDQSDKNDTMLCHNERDIIHLVKGISPNEIREKLRQDEQNKRLMPWTEKVYLALLRIFQKNSISLLVLPKHKFYCSMVQISDMDYLNWCIAYQQNLHMKGQA